MKNIAIIGAGWYGCHIGVELKKNNYNVEIFERNSSCFGEASGKNQNRLHAGFHYARNYTTRMQTVNGYEQFMQRYKFLTKEVASNLYLVPEYDSLLDFKTYCTIMTTTGATMEQVDVPKYLSGIGGAIRTEERVILTDAAREHFSLTLKDNINYNFSVEVNEKCLDHIRIGTKNYDYLIDCTWGHYGAMANVTYEASLLLKVKKVSNIDDALTFVDGNLCSLYPTQDENIYTLSSVLHTPLKVSNSAIELEEYIKNISDTDQLQRQGKKMIEHIEIYYPKFQQNWEFFDYQLSIKTKPVNESSDRSCSVELNGRKILVLSGKIDTIFHAAEQIKKIID